MAADTTAGEEPDRQRWLAFGFLLLAAAMSLIDLTVVNIGIPAIRRSLHPTQAATEWIISAYALAYGLGLITGGRLGDIYGRRRVFAVGVAGFVAGSVVCGVAPNMGIFLGGRVVQASFAALMMPQVLGSVGALFPPAERFKAMGLFGATMGLATVIGPLLGAGILQLDIAGLDWRPVFLINVPIGLLAVVGALRTVPDSRRADAPPIDPLGAALLTVALVLLLYPLVEGRSLGWPAWIWAMMAASVPALGLFALHQSRLRGRRTPLVPVSLLQQRSFAGGLVVNMVFASGFAGYFLALSLTLQLGLEFTPVLAAFAGLPVSIGMVIASPKTIKLMAKVPGHRLVLAGIGLMAAGMLVTDIAVQLAGASLTVWDLIPGSIISGLGMGAVSPILSGVILADVDQRDAGAGAGVLATGSQIATSVGVAVIGAIFFGALPGAAALTRDLGGGYTDALATVLDYQVLLYIACAILAALVLPRAAPQRVPERPKVAPADAAL
jgi:EmrB/QacA subfamily drug resistance transporter